MAKTSLGDFLRSQSEFLTNLGNVLDEVDRGGMFDFVNARGQAGHDKWWELFDLDVEPRTRPALDLAWRTWQSKNHPDKGVCSHKAFVHMKELYERQREKLPEEAATG